MVKSSAAGICIQVLCGLHEHLASLLTPTKWDNGFYMFTIDLTLGQMPSTVDFNEEWLDLMETPTCTAKDFSTALAQHNICGKVLSVCTSVTDTITPALIVTLCLAAPLFDTAHTMFQA
eukprot:5337668-Ditylum_brightwellii.AAC.1